MLRAQAARRRTTPDVTKGLTRSPFTRTPAQVIDDDGVDRTPKPLLTVKPSVLRGMGGQGGGHEDGTLSPSSEAGSEFFLDRLSSANFSRQGPGGW